MATCRDVVTNALKLARILSPGEDPESTEAADGLTCLQSLYDQWLNNGMFGELEDVYLDEDDAAEEGKRYFVPTGITLTDATSSYVDSCNVTRQPRDLAVYETLTEAGTRAVKLYDRTQWVDLLGLGLSDDAPLSSRGEMGLAGALAISGAFAAMFNDTATMNPDVRKLAGQFVGAIMRKGGSTQATPTADYF